MNFNEMKKKRVKNRNKNQKSYKLRSSFILRKNRQEQKPRNPKICRWTLESFDLNQLFVNLIE